MVEPWIREGAKNRIVFEWKITSVLLFYYLIKYITGYFILVHNPTLNGNDEKRKKWVGRPKYH